jgi:exosome complex component RRP46
MTLTSVILAFSHDGTARTLSQNPSLQAIQEADSVHVLAFASNGGLLVVESEGSFTIDDWEEIHEVGKRICCDEDETSDEDVMQENEGGDERNGSMMHFVKSVLKERVERDLHWKE